MFNFSFFGFTPGPVDPCDCTSKQGKEVPGEKASCPDPGFRQRRVWNSFRQLGKNKLPSAKPPVGQSIRSFRRLSVGAVAFFQ
jgi:hypothetical protein